MTKRKLLLHIILGTLLSILVFFSISFITFLSHINPLHYYGPNEAYHTEIGFPFTYYSEFLLNGGLVPNSQWTVKHLYYDCFLTWIVVVGLYLLIARKSAKD